MIKITLKGGELLAKRALKIREIKQRIPDEIKKVCDGFAMKVVRLSKEKYILNGGYGAPVDPIMITSRSGNLRRNIVGKTEINGFKAIVTLGVRQNVDYAKIHEEGGVRVSSKGKSFYIKPRPFIKPAIAEALPSLKENLTGILKRIGATKDE